MRGGSPARLRSTALLALLLAVPVAAVVATVPASASPGAISTYTAPSLANPGGITAGPDGAMWFTNNTSIGRISTAGKITRYTGPGISDPRFITPGPDGALWFTNEGINSSGSIGRITTTGQITNYTDPTISAPIGITAGPDGALWFTNLGDFNAGDLGSIGRITTTGTVTNYRDATISEPVGIAAGSDGALWFTNEGINSIGSIGSITTAGIVTDHTDPNIHQPGFITAGPDGALWFTNGLMKGNYSIARITTAGTVTKYTDPGLSLPFGIAAGPDGAVWFANASGRSIGRITTAGSITFYRDPRVSGPEGIAAGPDGSMWFTNAGIDSVPTSIGRITTSVNATRTWTLVSVPNDSGRDFTVLNDISCASANSCTAVGYAFTAGSSPGRGVIESWNGTAWSLVASPTVGTGANSLFGVACVSTTSCKAVGAYWDKANNSHALIESWNGRAWSALAGPSPGTMTNQLLGVSCISASSCQAVGYSANSINGHRALNERTLVESWNGHSWSVVPSPNPGSGNDQLNDVACVSANSCTAVGNSQTSTGNENRTLVESWNGRAWSFVSSPNRGAFGALNGVSCVSAKACQAVGNYVTSTNQNLAKTKPLIESWNGRAWSLVASPGLSGGLEDVSCVSANVCSAVGETGAVTLVESWNGAAWSIVPSPNQGNNDDISSNELSGVSCLSPTSCKAIGTWNQDGFAEALAESYG
jgi:virginiamycin B lyase